MIPVDWSDPGETAGKPDRYQEARVAGLHLCAGSNPRKPDGSYVRADDDVPWAVTAWLLDESAMVSRLVTYASGVATSQSAAREAAEMAMRARFTP